MIRPAFPPVQTGKDVMLGILPFYHIFGMSLGSPLLQEEAKRTQFQAV